MAGAARATLVALAGLAAVARPRVLTASWVVACLEGLVSAGPRQGVVRAAPRQVATRLRAATARRVSVARVVLLRLRRARTTVVVAAVAAGSSVVVAAAAGSVTPRVTAPAAAAAAAVCGFAAASATGIGVGSLGQDTSGNGQAQITPVAGVCQPLLSILKVVTGQAPAGTTFTVHVVCSHVVITGVNAQASQTTVDRTLVFDALGHPFSGGNPTVIAAFTDTCNVTETASGGATTVSYACRDNHSTDPPFCQASNQDVVFGRSRIESAGVIVTNAFPTPQVIIQPTYAG